MARVGWPTAVCLAASIYTLPFVARGWIPHDEGVLAHSAERVLAGQLPHVDFDELYTGGLSELHALAFRFGGVRLVTLRWLLWLLFLPFVAVLYALARRFAPPPGAMLVAVLGLAWSLPNYFAAVPTWYVLFCAAFLAYLLIRSREGGGPLFLVAAGAVAAAALLVKVVGVYLFAAAILDFVAREPSEAASEPPRRRRAFPVLESLVAFGLLAATLALIRSRFRAMDVFQLALPVAVVGTATIALRGESGTRGLLVRVKEVLRLFAPFSIGFALPVIIFLVPYLRRGAVGDLLYGVLVLPQRRLERGSFPFPPWSSLFATVPYAVLLAATFARPVRTTGLALALAAALLAVLFVASGEPEAYLPIWESARLFGPIAVSAACAALFLAKRRGADSAQRSVAFPVVAVTALLGLVQFPFSPPIYFCFVAPFVLLTATAAVQLAAGARLLHVAVGAFYLVFALLRMNPGYVWNLGVAPTRYDPPAGLDLSRAGLRVPWPDAREYEDAVALLRSHAAARPVYAGPECPELYFLAGLTNPTRIVVDYLAREPLPRDSPGADLERRGVRAVAINRSPAYSARLTPVALADLAARYPGRGEAGRFEVRWKTDTTSSAGGAAPYAYNRRP